MGRSGRNALHSTQGGLLFKPQKGSFSRVGIYSPGALSMFYLENSRAAASRIPAIYVGQCIHDGWGCQHSLQKAHHKICCFLPGAHWCWNHFNWVSCVLWWNSFCGCCCYLTLCLRCPPDTVLNSAAYVAGWLDRECQNDLSFSEEDYYLCHEKFNEEVFRGEL